MQVLRLRSPPVNFAQDDGQEEEKRTLRRLAVGGRGADGIEKTLGDGRVGIDAAVAQERPVAARVLEEGQVNFADNDLFLFVRGLGEDASERVGQKAAAPELQPRSVGAVA